jgi:hypothetical protein
VKKPGTGRYRKGVCPTIGKHLDLTNENPNLPRGNSLSRREARVIGVGLLGDFAGITGKSVAREASARGQNDCVLLDQAAELLLLIKGLFIVKRRSGAFS